ncbi:hypothetical protein PR202_gb09020 [Eleusine coracana subsp. coracana]|uniref:Uncharacterized protein n=1 Tax=Eleusine coracana subsp. coracana TaxID=191504 RepID=A0AAV5EG63_ELECO|nr:hypothetical protein PR202_gb09020 [Eleusine coracana subsp. coracana]
MEPNTEKSGSANNLIKSRCSEINEICDETSIVAHKLIGQMLDTWLFVENNGLNELTGDHLGGGLASQGSQDDDDGSPNSLENLERDIVIHAVKRILPNVSKSCLDRVKRIMS